MCLEHKPNIVIDDGGDLVGMVPEKTVCIGACAKKFADRYGLRWAEGCPPRNRIAIEAIVGGREEYDG